MSSAQKGDSKSGNTPSTAERFVQYSNQMVEKNDNLLRLLEKAMIPEQIRNALVRTSKIQDEVFFSREKGYGKIAEMTYQEIDILKAELILLQVELAPWQMESLSGFAYTNRIIEFNNAYGAAKNSRELEIQEAYEKELEALVVKEIRAVQSNPKYKKPETEEEINLERIQAEERARAKLSTSEIVKRMKSLTEKEAETFAMNSENTLYAYKIQDFLKSYSKRVNDEYFHVGRMISQAEDAKQKLISTNNAMTRNIV